MFYVSHDNCMADVSLNDNRKDNRKENTKDKRNDQKIKKVETN